MRIAMWSLAVCGIVGMVLSVGIAQDRRFDSKSVSDNQPQSGRIIEYFSRSGKSGTTTGIGEKVAAPLPRRGNVTEMGGTKFRNRRIGRKTTPLDPTYGPPRKQFDTSRKNPVGRSEVVPADFNRRTGTSGKKQIRQVRATEGGSTDFNPFHAPGPSRDSSDDFRPAPIPKIPFPAKSPKPRPRTTTSRTTTLNRTRLTTINQQIPTVSIKWVKQSDINIGQECKFDLLVKNSGKVAAQDVTVDAYFPLTVRLTKAEPRPTDNQDHLTWNFPELGPGEEQVIRLSMIPSRRGALQTKAYVRFTGLASGEFNVQEPLIEITTKGPKEVLLGDPASQIVTISNPGTGIANNVTVEAYIPKGLEHPRGERLVMEIGSLNPGESRMVRLALAAVAGGKQDLKIVATADAAPTQEFVTSVEVISPSLKVELNGPRLRYIGRTATYALVVTNDGSAVINNVRLSHKMSDGFKFVQAEKGGKFDRDTNTVSWFIGHLDPGQVTELHLELAAVKLGTHLHRAYAISENGARGEDQLKTEVDGTASLVLEIIDLDDPVEVGAETAYEIRVRNEGSKAALNVGISCEIPNGVELIDARGPADYIAENGLVIFKSLKTLEPGKAAIYRVHVRGKIEGNHRFRARMASDAIQEPLIFEELTKFYGE